jgi:large subunit ribosomal protein L25
MQSIAISGNPRVELGKVATKINRTEGAIPCVLYGLGDLIHFTVTSKDVRYLVYTPDFKIAELTIGANIYRTILKDVQFHPISEAILHIDFLKLTDGQSVKVDVPLRLVGAAPGVKSGGRLIQPVRKVKIKCLPETLVDQVQLDISGLGQTSRVKDIIAQKGIEIMMSPSIPAVTIEIPRALRSAATAEAKTAGKKK